MRVCVCVCEREVRLLAGCQGTLALVISRERDRRGEGMVISRERDRGGKGMVISMEERREGEKKRKLLDLLESLALALSLRELE